MHQLTGIVITKKDAPTLEEAQKKIYTKQLQIGSI